MRKNHILLVVMVSLFIALAGTSANAVVLKVEGLVYTCMNGDPNDPGSGPLGDETVYVYKSSGGAWTLIGTAVPNQQGHWEINGVALDCGGTNMVAATLNPPLPPTFKSVTCADYAQAPVPCTGGSVGLGIIYFKCGGRLPPCPSQ